MFIVTGVSGGIGHYLAERLLGDGEIVYGNYNTHYQENLLYGNFSQVDITKPDEIEKWVSTFKEKLEKIIVINCVGINYNCFGHKSSLDDWHRVIEVNLKGTFNIIRAFLPYMRTQKFGRIINLSSVVPQIGVAGTSAYSSSKAGLWGLAKSLAKENAGMGVTINNLNLGYFDAGMIASVPSSLLEKIKESIPSGRLGDPAEVYEVIKMLVNVEYINGASIDINGGI